MDYFKHDINASEDDKICDLLAEAGYEALGYYWRFVEYLYSRGGRVAKSKIASVAWSLHMEQNKLEYIISNFNLFVDDGENISSRRVVSETEEFEANGKRMADIGRIGGQASAKARAKAKAQAQGQANAQPNAEADGQADAQQKKQKKEKKEKKESNTHCSFFEDVWAEYPKKLGKGDVTKQAMKELEAAGVDTVMRAVRNYKAQLERDRTDSKYICHGSTFFNGRWRDYVEPQEPIAIQPQQPRRKSF